MSDTWPEGVRVGHWTDAEARTGCTVVVFDQGTVAAGEIRGGAPATREFGLLDPIRTVDTVDAVVLSGGSAFGLAAADGVVGALAERGRGFPTAHGPVPIVIGMSLYDLGVGDPTVRPGPTEGRQALEAARPGRPSSGSVGAGTGATVDTWSGDPRRGGIGVAVRAAEGVQVAAIIAVNAFGRIDDGRDTAPLPPPARPPVEAENTTIGVLVTDAALDAAACLRVTQSGHDGLARALLPAHTAVDGDALVTAATGPIVADEMVVRVLATQAVTAAVRSLRSPGLV